MVCLYETVSRSWASLTYVYQEEQLKFISGKLTMSTKEHQDTFLILVLHSFPYKRTLGIFVNVSDSLSTHLSTLDSLRLKGFFSLN